MSIYLAMSGRKLIIPLEVEPAELPDELQYMLAPFQRHNLSTGTSRDVLARALAAI